jgi:hypothetical protein
MLKTTQFFYIKNSIGENIMKGDVSGITYYTKRPQKLHFVGTLGKSRCIRIMSNFLTPIQILLDMGIKTKSTYQAALEGLDQSMVKILKDIGYDHLNTNSTIELYRHPTDFRLEAAKNRLAAFSSNKEVGLIDFVKHARNIMYNFLEVINLGHIKEMSLDNSGRFNVKIGCMLHQSGIENNASEKRRFEDQLRRISDLGLKFEKVSGLNSYRFLDNDTNRSIVRQILSDRGASLIKINAYREEIDEISFTLDPKNLHKFTENPVDYTLPKTNELNDDEMLQMKKLIGETLFSLAFIHGNPDMLQTCARVAESSFSQIEEIVGYEGSILKRIRERYAKERSANMSIREIEKEIGSKFPVEIVRDVMEKVSATLAYFCVANLHSVARNISIDQWGILRMDVKWCSNGDDMRYVYYFGDKYNEPEIPSDDLVREVFDIVDSRNMGIRLIDNEVNKSTIEKFLKSACDFDVDSIAVVRDDCYVQSSVVGNNEKHLDSVFVIDQVSVSTDNVVGILRQHELCKMSK